MPARVLAQLSWPTTWLMTSVLAAFWLGWLVKGGLSSGRRSRRSTYPSRPSKTELSSYSLTRCPLCLSALQRSGDYLVCPNHRYRIMTKARKPGTPVARRIPEYSPPRIWESSNGSGLGIWEGGLGQGHRSDGTRY